MSDTVGQGRIGVIGGGIGGLAVAQSLCRAGFAVDLYEQDTELGGLAARCTIGDLKLDKYYHFVCGADRELVELCAELDLPIHWHPTKTSFYYEGKLYPFGSARHLLAFDALSLGERLRQAKMMLVASRGRDWRELDNISAEEWLIRQLGEHAYQVIWHPLLKVKFGARYQEISAAWIWHRVHRLLTSRRHPLAQELLGYMHQGAGELIARMAQDIQARSGQIYSGCQVQQVAQASAKQWRVKSPRGEQDYSAVVCAAPAPAIKGLLGSDLVTDKLKQVEYIGVVCMLLVLDCPITNSFWINTNDSRIAFNGFIEFSNLNPKIAAGQHVLYIPYYCHTSDPRFSMADEALFDEYLAALQLISPKLGRKNVLHWRVYRDQYAQPICTRGFADKVPPFHGPGQGLFVMESSQLYPADRNLSGAVALANQVAQMAGNYLRESK